MCTSRSVITHRTVKRCRFPLLATGIQFVCQRRISLLATVDYLTAYHTRDFDLISSPILTRRRVRSERVDFSEHAQVARKVRTHARSRAPAEAYTARSFTTRSSSLSIQYVLSICMYIVPS